MSTTSSKRRAWVIPEAKAIPKRKASNTLSFEPIIPITRKLIDLPSDRATIAEAVYPGGTSYWQHERGGDIEERFNSGCFGNLDYKAAVGITYLCVPSKQAAFTVKHLRFWLRFLRHCLKDIPWSAQITKVDLRGARAHPAILYRFPKLPANEKTALTYLSLMRYPSEHPRIVRKLFDERATHQGPEHAFTRFQAIHHSDTSFFSPHAVVYTRDTYDGAPSSRTPVPISTFRENVVKGRKRSVYSHFA